MPYKGLGLCRREGWSKNNTSGMPEKMMQSGQKKLHFVAFLKCGKAKEKC
jgi:hypothetical protein